MRERNSGVAEKIENSLKIENFAMAKTKIHHMKKIISVIMIAAFSLAVFSVAEAKANKLSVSSDVPVVHSRSAWSNAKYDKRSKKVWPAQFEDPKIIVVHHTATTSKKSTARQIRDIYKYHSYSKRWGDVGYNYLIGKDGAIFEGRYGGNGVIGAHAYNDRKKTNFNKGSIGIAILGNYEKSDPSPESLESLEKLIGWLAANNDIEIAGERKFLDKKIESAVVGHKDVDDTGCPGKRLYGEMSSIRTASAALTGTYATYAYKIDKKDDIFEITGGKRYSGSLKQPVLVLALSQLEAYPAESSAAVATAASSSSANKKKSKWQTLLEKNAVPETYWQKYLPKVSLDEYKKAVKSYQAARKKSAELQKN